MTTIILGAVHDSTVEVVHGARPIQQPIPVTPMEYSEMINLWMDEHLDDLKYTPYKGLYMNCHNFEQTRRMGAKIFFDDELVTFKKIIRSASTLMKGEFFPNNVGLAFPVSRGRYFNGRLLDDFHKTCTKIHWWSSLPFRNAAPSMRSRYTSAYINNREFLDHTNGLYLLSIRKWCVDYPSLQHCIVMGFDPVRRLPHRSGFVMDDIYNYDPMIMFLHPSACAWYRESETNYGIDSIR